MSTVATTPDPRDLSPQEAEARAAECHELNEQIKGGLRDGRQAAWKVAEAVYKFDEQSGWDALGYEDLSEYLRDPEVGISRAHYYRFRQVWEKMAVQRQVDPQRLPSLDVTKVQMILPALDAGKVQLKEALNDVESLDRGAIREKYIAPRPKSQQTPTSSEPKPGPDTSPDAPPISADQVAKAQDLSKEPAHNGETPSNSGQPQDGPITGEVLSPVGVADPGVGLSVGHVLAQFVWDLTEAPFWQKEKKKVPADWREEAQRVCKLAIDSGLLDV